MKMVTVLAHNRWFSGFSWLQGMLAGSGRVQGAGQILSPKTNDAREVGGTSFQRAGHQWSSLEAGRDIALEDLRALLHLYSRLDKEKMVEATGAKILARYPHDKETLLALASFYLERKDAPRALKYAQTKFIPDITKGGACSWPWPTGWMDNRAWPRRSWRI